MTAADIVSSDPDVQGGATVFTGTRVPLKNLIDYLEAGDSIEQFLDDFPSVSRDQAIAALESAKEALVTLAGAQRFDRIEFRGRSNSSRVESHEMHNEFTAIIEPDDDWFIAYCPEIPGANGQGRTSDEARANLSEAIALILEDRREDALRGVPATALRETVVVE